MISMSCVQIKVAFGQKVQEIEMELEFAQTVREHKSTSGPGYIVSA
jgi:hypothetical protein